MTLGPPIRKPSPLLPPRPEWMQVPDKPHLEQNAKGQLRTRLPTPPIPAPASPTLDIELDCYLSPEGGITAVC